MTFADTRGGYYCRQLLDRKLPKLLHEAMVHADDNYSETEYKAKWGIPFDDSNHRLVKTRMISGISPRKFEKYNIKFKNKNGDLISCAEVLGTIKYNPPQPAYYMVRHFELQ